MTQEQIEGMLKEYKQCVGSVAILEIRLKDAVQNADMVRNTIIENIAYPPTYLSGMPRSGKIADPAANLAVNICESKIFSHFDRQERELQKELSMKRAVICTVEALLSGLREKERWIVERHSIEGAYWREVEVDYRMRYGEAYTRAALKRIKRQAILKMVEMSGGEAKDRGDADTEDEDEQDARV